MNKNITKRNNLLSEQIIKGLEKRNMKGYYAEDKEEALKIALGLINEGATITMGGGMSVHEIGLVEALKKGNYNFIDRDEMEDREAAALAGFTADYFLTSANAMTQDGVLVNIDGYGNRVAATVFGPGKVIYIVGMNKVCADPEAALKRARNTAAPTNIQRFDKNTPCSKTGTCMNCTSPDCICSQILFTRYSMIPNRIHVVLVNDNLGF